jgi:hypothetical protein
MSVSTAATSEQLFTRDRAVEYCRSGGLEKVTGNTIIRAAYYSRKLARPRVIGNCAYWTKSDLDKWIATS